MLRNFIKRMCSILEKLRKSGRYYLMENGAGVPLHPNVRTHVSASSVHSRRAPSQHSPRATEGLLCGRHCGGSRERWVPFSQAGSPDGQNITWHTRTSDTGWNEREDLVTDIAGKRDLAMTHGRRGMWVRSLSGAGSGRQTAPGTAMQEEGELSAEAQAAAFEEQSSRREAVGGKARVGGCGPRACSRG